MLCFRSNPYALFFLFFFSLFLFGHETGSQALNVQTLNISGYCRSFVFGEREQSEVLAWRKIERRNLVEGSEGDNNSSLILAEKKDLQERPS